MQLPSWLIWYKKPEFRDIREYSAAIGSGKRPASPDGRGKSTIPSRLRLERILQNKTCSPMSLFDFHQYLKHIEFSAENLEFFVWYKNYERTYSKTARSSAEKDDMSFFSSSDGTSSIEKHGDFNLPSPSSDYSKPSSDPELANETLGRISMLISTEAPCSMNACQLPATVKSIPTAPPSEHRAELESIIKMFLLPGAEKELNIPPSMRKEALAALQTSSDPCHLRPIADHVYLLLRNCSHRNFVRLGVSNGTFETICVATALGIALTIAGFLCVLLLAFTPTLGAHSRWKTFAAWPMWWLGMSLILSGLRGSCFFLLLFSRRQPLPWERFDDSDSILVKRTGLMRVISRLMIFDRKVKVKDIHLRRLQLKIVMQSLMGGSVFASLSVLLFIFLPVWSETAV